MWRELSFIVERDGVERWCDALLDAGAASVQAEDADADSPDEQALFGEPGMPIATELGWLRTRLCFLVRANQDHQQILRDAGLALAIDEPLDVVSRVFQDEDWVRLTQSQFEPIRISRRLVITPTWHLSNVEASQATNRHLQGTEGLITIILDPGLAFGTGSHPTTRLCLRWLDEHRIDGQSVLDYGCGSGILAIAAAKLGASVVYAVDIDEQAILSSRDNADLNKVKLDLRSTRQPAPPACDVVVANILATPLKLLAPMLEALVKPGGLLILAGLLERQIDEVSVCYPKIDLSAFAIEEGWVCLAGVHRGNTLTGKKLSEI